MDRRTFLAGLGAVTASQMLSGCASAPDKTLSVRLLKRSIPVQLLNRFRQELKRSGGGYRLDFAPEPQVKAILALLESWKLNQNASPSFIPLPFNRNQSGGAADLVTLGDYWLAEAIQRQLIQPIPVTALASWPKLPTRWQALVTRDRRGQVTSQGEVWGMPYRWGSTVIAYRADLFKERDWQPPQDWADLWRSELQRWISLPDHPREVIGLTLKKLGQSYNQEQLASQSTLKAELQRLHQQVKLYSSNAYLQPLILGDTALAVGWSTDILPLMQTNPRIAAVVPASGTALWADLWVRSVAAQPQSKDLAQKWIDFCWQPETATQLSVLSQAASPLITTLDRAKLPTSLQHNSVLLPPADILERSEFLEPLSQQAIDQYRALWLEIRQIRTT